MNTTRIEVPLRLSPPHFDDDATIATARQVVPIKGARIVKLRRKTLSLLPLLIASTLCGALGALAVNYYERRRDVSTAAMQAPAPSSVSTSAQTAPPVATPQLTAKQTESQPAVQPDELKESSPSKPAIKAEETVAKRDEVEQLPAAIVTAERK